MNRLRIKPGAAGIIGWLYIAIVAAAELFALVWLYPMLQSSVVMSVYSAQQMERSVMKECGMAVDIPIADGWYPQMLAYNADGFAAWSGIDARMTVLYSFGAFDPAMCTSSLYDPDSDKYSAFYGAYVVKKDGGIFGYNEDGSLNLDEVVEAVRYDDTQLVMANFGCRDAVFNVQDIQVSPDAACAGSGGWTRIDAALRVSGAAHTFKEDKMAYLQYGKPMQPVTVDFAETDMTGRIYAKYFPSSGCTVMMYCLAPERDTVDACDDAALQGAVISRLQ